MGYMDEAMRARLVELAEEIEHSTFRETKWSRRGYSEKDVDDFLDYVVDVIAGLLSMDSAPHLMSVQSDAAGGSPGEYVPEEFSAEGPYEVLEGSEPEVTWTAPQATGQQPAVIVTSYEGEDEDEGDDAEVAQGELGDAEAPPVEVSVAAAPAAETAQPEPPVFVEAEQEATVAWQPEDDTASASEAPAPSPAAPQTVQPRPAGKPSNRPPGGTQPPLPPWAAHTG